MTKPRTHLFCIGHTKLCFDIPEQTYFIRTSRGILSDSVHKNLISLSEVSEDLDFYYPWLGGTAGLLAVPEVFREKKISYSTDDRIMTFQQAKIVTQKPIGWESDTYPTMKVLSPWLAEGIDIKRIASSGEEFMFPQIVSQPGGDMVFYSHVHHLPDYLRFCAICIDEGVLTPGQALDMGKHVPLIPGGGLLGITPIDYFFEVVEIAKKVCFAFLNKHRPGLKSSYQRIALGYLIERLTSYMLIKKILANYGGIPEEFIGYMVAVADSDYKHGSTSDFK